MGNLSKVPDEFMEAINDDFNTPKALAVIGSYYKFDMNQELFSSLNFLGLLEGDADLWFKGDIEGENIIVEMIEKRNNLRSLGDFSGSDSIRDELSAMGIIIEDKGNETFWRRSPN